MKVYRHIMAASALSVFVVAPACSDQASTTPDGPGIALQIGAVTYNGATDVCYGIAVHNAAGQLVVKLDNICSSDYGNLDGGDIGYVAPCDASGTGASTVTLWLEDIKIATGTGVEPEANYINPCGLDALQLETDNITPLVKDWPTSATNYDGFKCQKQLTCLPNADVKVSFNLTVMRDAQQGFFDVIVDFEDIFCSAKLDTCYAPTETTPTAQIQLLLDQDEDEPGRDNTAVMAFACTAGADTAENGGITTLLHLSEVTVTCDNSVEFTIDPTGAGGIKSVTVGANEINYALYVGDEALPCGSDAIGDPLSCNKQWWNLALDLEDLQEAGFSNCTLGAAATATGDGITLVDGTLDGDGVIYPAIVFGAQVTQTTGEATCDWNPLNGLNAAGGDSGVQTEYFGSGNVEGLPLLPVMCFEKAEGIDPYDAGNCE